MAKPVAEQAVRQLLTQLTMSRRALADAKQLAPVFVLPAMSAALIDNK